MIEMSRAAYFELIPVYIHTHTQLTNYLNFQWSRRGTRHLTSTGPGINPISNIFWENECYKTRVKGAELGI